MQIAGQTVVVTGANRGLGRSLVDALLDRGASKVYAAARNPARVLDDPRVVAARAGPPRPRDDRRRRPHGRRRHRADQQRRAPPRSPARSTPTPPRVRRRCAVNYDGHVRRRSAPSSRSSSATAAARSSTSSRCSRSPARRRWPATRRPRQRRTRSPRRCGPCCAAEGISVHGVYPAGIDTDMLAGIDAPKTPPRRGRRGRARRARRRRGGHLPRPERHRRWPRPGGRTPRRSSAPSAGREGDGREGVRPRDPCQRHRVALQPPAEPPDLTAGMKRVEPCRD